MEEKGVGWENKSWQIKLEGVNLGAEPWQYNLKRRKRVWQIKLWHFKPGDVNLRGWEPWQIKLGEGQRNRVLDVSLANAVEI